MVEPPVPLNWKKMTSWMISYSSRKQQINGKYQKSLDFRLDSGSSWLDGVNGILMQQEPNSPKQDYWNQRAIASLANTLFTVVSQFQCLYCLLCCCYSSRNARMKNCCYTNTCLNSYHYYQLWEGNKWCKKATSEVYLLCNPSPQVNQVMSKADKWTDRHTCVCMAV
jgi:hypothetical protein